MDSHTRDRPTPSSPTTPVTSTVVVVEEWQPTPLAPLVVLPETDVEEVLLAPIVGVPLPIDEGSKQSAAAKSNDMRARQQQSMQAEAVAQQRMQAEREQKEREQTTGALKPSEIDEAEESDEDERPFDAATLAAHMHEDEDDTVTGGKVSA